jgi:hypothetical protein
MRGAVVLYFCVTLSGVQWVKLNVAGLSRCCTRICPPQLPVYNNHSKSLPYGQGIVSVGVNYRRFYKSYLPLDGRIAGIKG